VIIYTEKGPGLHDAVHASGHLLVHRDGVWISSDDAAVQAIIDGYTLAQAKGAKCAGVLAHAKALRDKAIAAVSAGEMASWPIKRAEAAAFHAGDTSCPFLSAEAAARGITLGALVAKVDGNAARFQGLEAAIGGTDGKHRDAIMSLTTFAEIAAYDYSTGWPEV
jgi:hypothetical protein